ncbi:MULTISPECIES: Yip1 family protein [unclassified Blautia]|uniref:Yip1 family protein n=1 Tax=unclassified Blautia TaxID=2648079 RepID=UPI003F8AEB2C
MFCTKCGRKLEEGEICTCQQPKSVPKMQPQAKVEPQQVKKEQTGEPRPVDLQTGPSASQQNQKTETHSQSARQQGQQQQNAGYQQRQQYQQNSNYQQGQQYQQNSNYQQRQQYQQSTNYQQNANYQQRQQYQQNMNYQQGNMRGSREAEWAREKGTEALGSAKTFLGAAGSVLKRPVSEAVRMSGDCTGKSGLRFITVKAIFITIIVLILSMVTAGKIASASNGYFGFFDIKMPYLTLIVLSLIATIGFDMVKVGIMTMMTKAFGGSAAPKAMYSVVGVQAVFDLLITAVICVLMIISPSIATVVAFTLGLVYAIGLTPFVGYASYTAVTNMDKDKRVYAFWIIIILLVIVALVICLLVGVGVVEKIESIVNSSYDSYSNSLDSLFNMFS